MRPLTKENPMNLDKIKNYIAKNKPVIAVGIVAVAAVSTVVIDLAMRDNSPLEFDALKESE